MNDPRFLNILILVFILLGAYSLFTGIRRMREASARAQRLIWYKQINILTGIEYLLLSLVFVISLNIQNRSLPASLRSIIVPVYFTLLLAAALLAGMVIRQAFQNARALQRRQATLGQSLHNNSTGNTNNSMSGPSAKQQNPEQKTIDLQRRRVRRQKAVAARRRHAGKA